MQRRRNPWVIAGAVTVIVLAVAAVVQQRSLRDLRRVEALYVEGRQVTACANVRLERFAGPGAGALDVDEIDRTVAGLVVEAADASKKVRTRMDEVTVVPLPPLLRGRHEVRTALAAQVRLYDTLVADPGKSDDELLTLGRSNNRAERQLAKVRSVLLVGKPTGWNRRFTCRAATAGRVPDTQASSSSSSSSM